MGIENIRLWGIGNVRVLPLPCGGVLYETSTWGTHSVGSVIENVMFACQHVMSYLLSDPVRVASADIDRLLKPCATGVATAGEEGCGQDQGGVGSGLHLLWTPLRSTAFTGNWAREPSPSPLF